MPKYAYLTLLGSNNYLLGTLALNYSLNSTNTQYPLIVLVTENINSEVRRILEINNIRYLEVPNIQSRIKKGIKKEYPHWENTFSKLTVFGMTQFDKIIFLDSDMLVMDNIDELFNKKNLSAVVAGKSFPGNENWVDLNSGVMVIEPKIGEDSRLIKLMSSINSLTDMGDQDVIQRAYPNWKNMKNLHLSEEYNVFAPYEPYYINAGKVETVKIVHFVGGKKPWNMNKYEKIRYIMKVSYLTIKASRSLKGLRKFMNDYNYYDKICNTVMKNIEDSDTTRQMALTKNTAKK